MPERRRFSRILYATPACLSQGGLIWPCALIDISLQGALIARPANWHPDEGEDPEYQLSFPLGDSDMRIAMTVTLAHQDRAHLGLACRHMDIDSITRLRRLIEFNLGNDALLHRELAQLLRDATPLP